MFNYAALEPLEGRILLSTETDILNLVPTNQTTHVAIASGNWTSTSTWGGAVPNAGAKVHIPSGKSVTYDVQSAPPALKTIRIDGDLGFATNIPTTMSVDTLVVAPNGHLTIGTAAAPVQSGKIARITFPTSQVIDTNWDPARISRGLLSLGSVEIHGKTKSSFIETATDPGQGATSVTLASAPSGWSAGDKVILTGITFQDTEGSKDEVRTIQSVSGSTVTFTSGLSHSHRYNGTDEAPVVLGNYSRNVIIESAGDSSTPASRRAHMMIAGNGELVAVEYAELNRLGRTNKAIPIEDVGTNVDGSSGDGSNVRGRYALHLHHRGVGAGVQPDTVRGLAITDSPGWGIATHGSYVNITDNVSYDIFGAHYVTEDGNERGSFVHNLAVRSDTGGLIHLTEGGLKYAGRVNNFDLGYRGHGFWFQGRNLDVRDNFVSGVEGEAFVYFHRFPSSPPQGGVTINGNTATENLLTPHRNEIAKGRTSFVPNEVPIVIFDGNSATSSYTGVHVVKNDADQFHDLRNMFTGFTAWSVQNGVKLEYTGKYTFRDLRLHGDPTSTSPHRSGFVIGNHTVDVVLEDADFSGFGEYVHFSPGVGHTIDEADAVFIDVNMAPTHNKFYVGPDHQPLTQQQMEDIDVLSGSSLVPGRLSFAPAGDQDWGLPASLGGNLDGSFLLRGTKTDSIGSVSFGEDLDPPHDAGFLLAEQWHGDRSTGDLRDLLEAGYYQDVSGGPKYLHLEAPVADRVTGEVIFYCFKAIIEQNYSFLGPNLGPYDGDCGHGGGGGGGGGGDDVIHIEAENASGSAAGSGVAASSEWLTVLESGGGYSGGGIIQASPNAGVSTGDTTVGPRRDYAMTFPSAGTYHVWVRLKGASGSDDSVHVGLNGTPTSYGAVGVTTAEHGRWVWTDTVGTGRATVTVPSAGTHTFNLWMREDGIWVDKFILTNDTDYNPGAISEVGGSVEFEAESTTITHEGVGTAAGSSWSAFTDSAAEGGSALQALPNSGVNVGDQLIGARSDYDIDFSTTGTYYVWVRQNATQGTDDSVHVALDGSLVSGGQQGMALSSTQRDGNWHWVDSIGAGTRVTINVTAAGLHTLSLYMREDGAKVDRFVLTQDANFNPETVTADFEAYAEGDTGSSTLADSGSGLTFKGLNTSNGLPDNLVINGPGQGFASKVLRPLNWSTAIEITRTGGGAFDLISFAYASDRWGTDGDFTVTGYNGTTQVGQVSKTFTITTLSTLALNWTGLTRAVIDYRGGASGEAYGVIDDVVAAM